MPQPLLQSRSHAPLLLLLPLGEPLRDALQDDEIFAKYVPHQELKVRLRQTNFLSQRAAGQQPESHTL